MSSPPRSVLGYLLLPRASDVTKWLFLPTGFALGAVTRGTPEPLAIAKAVVIWLCLELLVYQARYQWNDIRGFEADQLFPDGDRGRLPGPLSARRARIGVSAAVAVAKVAGAVCLCLLLGRDTGWLMAFLVVAVFALAAIYEGLRSVSTGRSSAVPAPATPGIVAIWLVVGVGYGLRTITGLSLAVDVGEPALLLVAAALTCWLFGVAWTTSRWTIEATAFAELDGDMLRWRAQQDQAREHQLALVRWIRAPSGDTSDGLRHWAVVRGPAPWSAPWAWAGVGSGAAAVVTGLLLVDPAVSTSALALGLAVGALSSAALLAAGRRREIATAVATIVVASVLSLSGADRAGLAALPWVCVAVGQACYLRQDRASLGGFLKGLRRNRRGPRDADVRSPVGTGAGT